MKTSELYSINWRDVSKGLIIAVGAPVLYQVQAWISAGHLNFNWNALGMIAVGGLITYLTKNFFTPAQCVTPAEK